MSAAGAGLVQAQPAAAPMAGAIALEYRRGAGAAACPEEAVFRDRTRDLFELDDPFVAAGMAATAHMRVEILQTATRTFEATLTLADAQGKALAAPSVEHHESCDALVWMLAHAMGLVIQRRPQSAPAPPEPVPPVRMVERVVVQACDEKCIEKVRDELCAKYRLCMDLTLTVMAGGLMTAGWTADVGPGAWLGFEVQRDWFSMGVEARGLFPAKTITYETGRTSDASTFSGLLVPCARWKWLLGCAFVEAGAYIFTIPGNSSDVTEPLISFGPRGGVDVPLAAGFSLRGFADLAIHPYAPIFGVSINPDPGAPVKEWHTPWVSGFFGVGIAWSH